MPLGRNMPGTCTLHICPIHMVSGRRAGWFTQIKLRSGGGWALCPLQHQRLHPPPASCSHDFLWREGYCSFHGQPLLLVAITSTNRFVQIPWKSCRQRSSCPGCLKMRYETWCDVKVYGQLVGDVKVWEWRVEAWVVHQAKQGLSRLVSASQELSS